MKKVLVLAIAVCAIAVVSCSQESCLKKKGYSSCEDMKKAFNLQDNDEAIRYHDLAKGCGCI